MTTYRAEDQSGHAIHFLKRLPRASGEAAELALHLYHDPELLRRALMGIRIPKTFDRVALSLHESDNGPYIVASRTGKFVTCLGEAMSIKGLHFIPHSQLLAHLDKSEVYRERLALAEELVGEGGRTTNLLERMRDKAEDLSREEFLALSTLQPALQRLFFFSMFGCGTQARDLSRYLHRQKKVGKREEENLKKYYRYFFATGHLAALSGMNRVKALVPLVDDIAEHSEGVGFISLLAIPLRSGRLYMATRLAWLVGKIGPSLLPECRRRIVDAKTPEAWLLGLLGALVIGNRHSKVKKQALHAVLAAFDHLTELPRDAVQWMKDNNSERVNFPAFLVSAIAAPDNTYKQSLDFAKELFVRMAKSNHFPKPYGATSTEEVADSIALAFTSSLTENFRQYTWLFSLLIMLTPWLARCEAEDLYLPKDFLDAIHTPWDPKTALKLLEDERERLGTPMPVTVEKTPGRNDLCPCGSGKKYKKCCACG
jgi:hypothetical protein